MVTPCCSPGTDVSHVSSSRGSTRQSLDSRYTNTQSTTTTTGANISFDTNLNGVASITSSYSCPPQTMGTTALEAASSCQIGELYNDDDELRIKGQWMRHRNHSDSHLLQFSSVDDLEIRSSSALNRNTWNPRPIFRHSVIIIHHTPTKWICI